MRRPPQRHNPRASAGHALSEYDPVALAQGRDVEMREHDLPPDIATRIAADHLTENRRYYARPNGGLPDSDTYPAPARTGSASAVAWGPFLIQMRHGKWEIGYGPYVLCGEYDHAHGLDEHAWCLADGTTGRQITARPSFPHTLFEPASLEDALGVAGDFAAELDAKYVDAGATWRRLLHTAATPGRHRLVDASRMFYRHEHQLMQLLAVGWALGRLAGDRALNFAHNGRAYRLEAFPVTGAIRNPRDPKSGAVYIPMAGSGFYDTFRVAPET